MKRIRIAILALLLAIAMAITACAPAQAAAAINPASGNGAPLSSQQASLNSNQAPGMPGRGGPGYRGWSSQGQLAGGAGLALGPLSAAEIEGLTRAIQEEYRAQALYQSVLDALGDAIPFNRIVRSEGQHAAQLERLAEKYGVVIPAAGEPGDLPEYSSVEEACQAGVEAEVADAALYDDIMVDTTHADLLRVYANLQAASLNNHLPAFQACQ